jgi:hypothetical protein
MGTSQSSYGSPSAVPMVPPWVSDPSPDNQDDDRTDGEMPSAPIAPVGRFRSSRVSLGRFSISDSSNDMRRGIGHYVGKGLGGAGTAVRRFGGTTRTAGTLYGVLSGIASGRTPSEGALVDVTLLRGRSAEDVTDALIEIVRPIDGTQDTEASRESIRKALAEVLERYPDADLLNLSQDERVFVIERYIALDVFARFNLDVGKALQNKAPSAVAALDRLSAVRDYIREEISASFRRLRETGQNISGQNIVNIVRQALHDTFRVFEDYVK